MFIPFSFSCPKTCLHPADPDDVDQKVRLSELEKKPFDSKEELMKVLTSKSPNEVTF